jgi:hypothetical protein
LTALAIVLFFSITIYIRANAQHEKRSVKSTALVAVAGIAGIGIAATATGIVPQSLRTSIASTLVAGGIALSIFLWSGAFSDTMDSGWIQAAAQ